MADLARHWTLDPEVCFLNHGSFGACPRAVLDVQAELRARMEREPVLFLARELEGLIDGVKQELAAFVGAEPEDLVPVPNATTGVNTVVRSLALEPGDELLFTDHGYNACNNAARFACEQHGAQPVVVRVPFPLTEPSAVVAAVLERVTPRTRLAVIDHVTSPTGLVLPIAEIVRELAQRGVDTLVDGAHAPGMVALDVQALGAAYYTGNCHKWVCAPKGAAFLWARRDKQPGLRPMVISHGANSLRHDRSRFRLEFDWIGTDDPSAFLAVPAALRFMGKLWPGGWDELRKRNRSLVLAGRDTLIKALDVPKPAPDAMIGSLASIPLPDADYDARDAPVDPLQAALFERWRIEVPVHAWPAPPKRLVRISAQAYNRPEQYAELARALLELL